MRKISAAAGLLKNTIENSSDAARHWVHDVLNAMNAIQLCTAALDVTPNADEQLEWLTEIQLAADKMVCLLDEKPQKLPTTLHA